MFKRIATFTVVLVFLLASFAIAAEVWGSRKSNKYHYPDCRWAQKILLQNLIRFPSPEAAIRAGYVPCKVCRPPITSSSEANINDEIKFVVMKRAYTART